MVEANQNEINLLQAERDEYKKNNKGDRNYNQTLDAYDDRIKQLQTGKLDLTSGLFGTDFLKRFDVAGKLANQVTESEVPIGTSFGEKEYYELSPEEKLDSIRALLRSFGDRDDIDKARLLYEQEIKKGELFGQKLNEAQLLQANDVIEYLKTFGDDPLGELEKDEKDEFLKQLIPNASNVNPKELSKKVSSVQNVNSVSSGQNTGGGGDNVAVLPMGNNNQGLARNDTGGLTSGPATKIHPSFDIDNFVAPINMANFNIV